MFFVHILALDMFVHVITYNLPTGINHHHERRVVAKSSALREVSGKKLAIYSC